MTTNETITAHPLSWPMGWKRTNYRTHSRYGDRSVAGARAELVGELRLMGAKDVVISSNLELRNDGMPRSGQRQPSDPGVAVYFKRKGANGCFACDTWLAIEDNIWAIVLTVKALRQIDRAGASDMLDRAFTGFAALPAPSVDWWTVLGVNRMAPEADIRAKYRELAKRHHPDVGGDRVEFERIQQAWKAAKEACGAPA